MQKKNTPATKPTNGKKSSSSKFITFATIGAMLASVFSTNLSHGQNTDKHVSKHTKEIIELLAKKNTINYEEVKTDTINYEEVKKYPIDWMIRHYGVDKTIEITQQCILIELNKIRSEN
jgi:hypothetical protein